MILQLMAVIFESHPTNTAIPPIFNFCTGLSNSQAMSLLHALRDSYDANRVLYLDLLQVIPAEKLGLMVKLESVCFCLLRPKYIGSGILTRSQYIAPSHAAW